MCKTLFVKNREENESERPVPELFLFFKKASNNVKASFNVFW